MIYRLLVPVIFSIGALGAIYAADVSPPAFKWSRAAADTFLARFPDPDAIHWVGQTNQFSWQAGYAMFTFEKLWRLTGDERYFNYIKRYVDQQVVDEQGNIPDFVPTALDNFLPGYAILFMYEQTGQRKYLRAAKKIYDGFHAYPRNADGSFWHADWAKHQLWVDGVFMAQMFNARYAKISGDLAAFDLVTQQMKLALDHCLKPNGLLLHGWDESRAASWADKKTGLAAEVWSEGLGWYALLLADVFDYLPADHPDREPLLSALRKLCQGLKDVQDSKTGMWCQVVDKPTAPGNWNETSGTGMFIYLIRKSIDAGYIDRAEYMPIVKKAYDGTIKKARPATDGHFDIVDCSSIGIKDNYQAYIDSPKEVNPFAGVTSFILGTSCMEKR
jgi:rhamnogalacturonyl hydrolase YesR